MTDNREAWLERAVVLLATREFMRIGRPVPPVRVSVGFPGGRGGSKRTAIGQCWSPDASADRCSQVFISPVLSDAVRVLDVLAHELIHAIEPTAGHGAAFKRIALGIGLTGKMTATVAGPELAARLAVYAAELGEYPHAQLNPGASGIKKQGTRLLKASCESCGYVCRVTAKWVEAVGAPLCACSGAQMSLA